MVHSLVPRPGLAGEVAAAMARSPVVAVLGPRQCGKTTLARQMAAGLPDGALFDLESPLDRRRLETPMLALQALRGLVVLDEIQLMPELFALLRVLADRPDRPATFLLLGSASLDVVRGVSQSLAGRVAFVEATGFSALEVEDIATLWSRGGFPRSYLAPDDEASARWRQDFVQTFLYRDLAALRPRIAPATLGRFWTMLAHYHGQTLNASELARSMGKSDHTVRDYIDALSGTFMVRQLQPWHENVGKRLVKAPKIYLRDSGILHALMEIPDGDVLQAHPKVGASWEGFALEQVLAVCRGTPYFWATYSGAELDLFLQSRGMRWGFEFKRSDAPRITKSMRIAMEDLRLQHLWVVYPGTQRYALAANITALPLGEVGHLAGQCISQA